MPLLPPSPPAAAALTASSSAAGEAARAAAKTAAAAAAPNTTAPSALADAAAGAAAGATLVFEWEVAGDPDGTGELVTLALPHHIAALALGSVWRDGPHFDTIKGTLTPIRGTRWSVRERFAPMGWNSPRAPARELVSTIKSSLQLDLAQPLVLRPDAKVRAPTAERARAARVHARVSRAGPPR